MLDCPKCHEQFATLEGLNFHDNNSHGMTGSTLFLIERDQWKQRALAAESKLEACQKALLDTCNELAAKDAERLRLVDRLDAAQKQLRALLYQPHAERDHLTSCDRIMGATHPCTCHADEYRALLEKL